MERRSAAIAGRIKKPKQLAAEHIEQMHAAASFSKDARTILEHTERHWCPFIAYAILGPSLFSDLFQPLKTSYALPSGESFMPLRLVKEIRKVFDLEYDPKFRIDMSEIQKAPFTGTLSFHQNVEMRVLDVLKQHRDKVCSDGHDILERYAAWKLYRSQQAFAPRQKLKPQPHRRRPALSRPALSIPVCSAPIHPLQRLMLITPELASQVACTQASIARQGLKATLLDLIHRQDTEHWANHVLTASNTPLFRMCNYDLSCNTLLTCREQHPDPLRVKESQLGTDLLDALLAIVLRANGPQPHCTDTSPLHHYSGLTFAQGRHIKICSVYGAKKLCEERGLSLIHI
jgi:hypothetical protein